MRRVLMTFIHLSILKSGLENCMTTRAWSALPVNVRTRKPTARSTIHQQHGFSQQALPIIHQHGWHLARIRTQGSSAMFSSVAPSSSISSYSQEAFSQAKINFESATELHGKNLESIPSNLDAILSDFETEASEASFWDAENKERNSYVNSQISRYSRLKTRVEQWAKNKDDCEAALEMIETGLEDPSLFTDEERLGLLQELDEASSSLLADSERYQLELLLSGPYDDQPCRILLTAGAGGTEACDWVNDLKRMYQRHAEKMGYSIKIEDEQSGEVVGYKSVEMIVDGGQHPYGWFKGEKGAHRLVRLSPFNSNNKRQTTFAGVDVAPILMDDQIMDIEIPDKELEITTMRSGGAGGQNVNKVSSAVRIKHIPSGLSVKCTQERSQSMNKDLALKRLKGQLLAIANEQRVAAIKEIRGDQVEASWGAQIRNYVLHPYKMVKDQRSGWESSNTQAFLDGDMEDCIASILRHYAEQAQEDENTIES